jgi:Tfp pilus assembly protein PilN
MKVRLNFARAPFRNERLPWAIYGLATVVLLSVTVLHGVVLTRYLMREQEALDVKVEALQDELSRTEDAIRRTENELTAQRNDARTERIRFLTNVYRHKGFSWTGLFNELEALTPAAVRITSIAPAGLDDKEDEIQEEIEVELQIVARSLDDVLEMVRRLEAARYLTTVLPLVEDEGGPREGGEGVSTVLTLQYLPHERDTDSEKEVVDGAVSGGENEVDEGDNPPEAAVKDRGEATPEATVDQNVPGKQGENVTPGPQEKKK